MGEPRDLRNPEFPRLSSRLGDLLLGLYKKDCPASKEFQYMGREFKAFHASYQIIRPYLQQPSNFISDVGADLVQNIHDGVETICEDILGDIQPFKEQLDRAKRSHEERVRFSYFLHRGKPTVHDRNKRILKFFEEDDYDLARCQLRYGNMLLNLMLAVFVYAQCIHDAVDDAPFPDTSGYLIADLYTALAGLRSKERHEKKSRKRSTLAVEASWWWSGLPYQPPNVEPVPPLATLTKIWVNPEARMAARPSAGVQEFQDTIRQWRGYSERQRRDFLQLDADNQVLSGTNQQLTSDNIQLRRDNDALRQATDRLHQDISRLIDEIQIERNARHEQEQRANYYHESHDAAHHRYVTLLAETERAERHTQRTGRSDEETRQDSGNGTREQDWPRHRNFTTKGPSLDHRSYSTQLETSSRSRKPPPMTYETQRRDRRRHSSSSSRRSNESTDRWSRTSTAVENPSIRRSVSPKAPDIPLRTRPFRTKF